MKENIFETIKRIDDNGKEDEIFTGDQLETYMPIGE